MYVYMHEQCIYMYIQTKDIFVASDNSLMMYCSPVISSIFSCYCDTMISFHISMLVQ